MKCREASKDEWDAIVSSHPEATVFHSRAWMELWEKYTIRGRAKCYIFEDNNDRKVYLPGLERKLFKGLVTRFDSGPEGTYGGYLIADTNDLTFIVKVISSCRKKFSFYVRQIFSNGGLFYDYPVIDTTQILSISKTQNPSASYSENIKRNIQKAISNKIIVEPAENESDWKIYYGLYQESAERWGKKVNTLYPYSFFKDLYHEKRLVYNLWLAKKENQVIYGCIVFYHGSTAYYWHGSGNKTALETGAASLLHDYIISDAITQGFCWYDFMPNGGNQSLHRFKSGFGTDEKMVYGFNYKTTHYLLFEILSRLIHGRR